MHVPAFVVPIWDAKDMAASGARGLSIVERISNQQHLVGFNAEMIARMQQWQRVRLLSWADYRPTRQCRNNPADRWLEAKAE